MRQNPRQARPKNRVPKGMLPLTQDNEPPVRPVKRSHQPLAPRTMNQAKYIEAVRRSTITIATGPAGVGKTWLAAALAAEAIDDGVTDRIVVTRPAVEAGESLGFLPGELVEKYEPWLRPVKEVLVERLGAGPVEFMLKRGDLEAMPLAYMRGNTFKNAWVILDEAQNLTPKQMYLFLTRIGDDAHVIINGDLDQKDIPGPSGLADVIQKLRGLDSVTLVEFTPDDIVRSGIVKEIVRRYAQKNDAVSERYTDDHEDDASGLHRMLHVVE